MKKSNRIIKYIGDLDIIYKSDDDVLERLDNVFEVRLSSFTSKEDLIDYINKKLLAHLMEPSKNFFFWD